MCRTWSQGLGPPIHGDRETDAATAADPRNEAICYARRLSRHVLSAARARGDGSLELYPYFLISV
jgi:hypothetical protein